MHPLSDPDLVAHWQRGFHDAYAVLVARHYGLVLAACLRQAPAGEAEDCAQAVFLVLSRRADAAAKAPVLVAWLLKVTGFVCRNACRSRQRRHRAEASVAATASNEMAPEAGERSEALEHLDQCLMRLPAKQRSALTLHFLAGKSAEEVAASMQTSRDNAYQLISRGLAALRVLLAKRGVAVSSVALASVFSAEVSAAAVQPPASVLASLTTAPSSGVLSLAQGAMTTMTITTVTPFACAGLAAASLLLGIGLAAEDNAPTTSPQTAAPTQRGSNPNAMPQVASGLADPSAAHPPATPNARPGASGLTRDQAQMRSQPAAVSRMAANPEPEPLAARLKQRITITFTDTDVADCIAMLDQMAGPNVIHLALSNGDDLPPVTLNVTDQELGQVLSQIEQLTGLMHGERNGVYVLFAANKPAAP